MFIKIVIFILLLKDRIKLLLVQNMTKLNTRNKFVLSILCTTVFHFYHAGQSAGAATALKPYEIKAVVDSLSNQIVKYYVFKPEAVNMSAYLKKRLASGAYNSFSDQHSFAAQLTEDVRSIQSDEHFHVEYNPLVAYEISGDVEDVPKMVAQKLNQDRAKNFGFKKMEILNGNIGYLEISSFARLNKYSRETADAALKLISNARAIIIDLRYGVGGSPEMVNYIISHFFKNRTHAIDIVIRSENATLPYWTNPDTTNNSLHNTPIYILTSYKTFSAAEGLAYELQYLKRATIVGEVTRGGAHTVTYRPLSNGFIADIPFGRAINPDTKKNWERIGITPDIKVVADEALETAEAKIFEQAFKTANDSAQVSELRWQQRLIHAKNHPFAADSIELKKLTGKYGAFKISFNKGNLYYQKTGKANFQMVAISNTTMRPNGNDTFFVEFVKDATGKANSIKVYYDDSRSESAVRTE